MIGPIEWRQRLCSILTVSLLGVIAICGKSEMENDNRDIVAKTTTSQGKEKDKIAGIWEKRKVLN